MSTYYISRGYYYNPTCNWMIGAHHGFPGFLCHGFGRRCVRGLEGESFQAARWEVIPPKHNGVFSRGNSSQKMFFSKNPDMKKWHTPPPNSINALLTLPDTNSKRCWKIGRNPTRNESSSNHPFSDIKWVSRRIFVFLEAIRVMWSQVIFFFPHHLAPMGCFVGLWKTFLMWLGNPFLCSLSCSKHFKTW